jgi:hypothetical protein
MKDGVEECLGVFVDKAHSEEAARIDNKPAGQRLHSGQQSNEVILRRAM